MYAFLTETKSTIRKREQRKYVKHGQNQFSQTKANRIELN